MKTMVESRRIEELRRRVLMDPASIAFAVLAEEYRRAGRLDAAIDTCLAGLERHPSYISARVTLACALQASGRLDEAQSQFEVVLRSAPENLAAIRGLAQIHEQLGRTPEPPPTCGDAAEQVDALEGFLGAIRKARGDRDGDPDS
jgi:tetratricopeptide (TPR) repeat protein